MAKPKKIILGLSLIFLFCDALAYTEQDSIRNKSILIITPRLNSTGHFPFTGSIVNRNLNFDLNVYFEKNLFGFFIFKSLDLEDNSSIINYLQPGIFKRFKIGKHIEAGPYAGYVFSQKRQFRAKDSDFWAAGILSWRTSRFEIQNTALVLNLSEEQSLRTLANRLLITIPVDVFKIDLYLWERVVFKTQVYSTAAALAVSIPEIRLSEFVSVKVSFLYQGYLTTRKPDYAMRKGFIFSIAVPVSM